MREKRRRVVGLMLILCVKEKNRRAEVLWLLHGEEEEGWLRV